MSALVLHHPECWEAVSSGCPWSTHWYSKPEACPSLEACKGKITLWNIYSKLRGSNKLKYLQLSVLEDWVNITFKDTWIDRSFSERNCVTFNTLMVWIDSTKKIKYRNKFTAIIDEITTDATEDSLFYLRTSLHDSTIFHQIVNAKLLS